MEGAVLSCLNYAEVELRICVAVLPCGKLRIMIVY